MFGITSENAVGQAKVILVLAIVWLAMAIITKKHRKVTIVIYAAISVFFEAFGLCYAWVAIRTFSRAETMNYFTIVFFIISFLIMAATYLHINLSDKKDENAEGGEPYDIDSK